MKGLATLLCFLIFPSLALGQSPASLIEKGNNAYAAKNFTEAKKYFEEALKEDANKQFPQAHFNLGNVYYHLKNFSTAIDEYETFINSVAEKNLQSQAYYNIGTCFLAQENYAGSVDAFKKALQLNPKNEDARYNLSFALIIISKQNGTASVPNPSPTNQKKNQPKKLLPLSQQDQQKLIDNLSQSEAQAMKKNLPRSNQSVLKKDW